jgi:fluoroquinolone resistance protein
MHFRNLQSEPRRDDSKENTIVRAHTGMPFMSDTTSEETYVHGKSFSGETIVKGEYEACTFEGCNLSNADLTDASFVDCEFRNCDLSLAALANTALRNVHFDYCKLLGLQFHTCNKFGLVVSYSHCVLNLSSFYGLNLKKTVFTECSLRETDFTAANLSAAVFAQCDLFGALFGNTILERTDFRTAVNYVIDPEQNRMKKARFSTSGIAGLLCKYNIDID